MSAEQQEQPAPPPIPTMALKMEVQAWQYVHGYLMLALRVAVDDGEAKRRVHRIIESIGLMLVKVGAVSVEDMERRYRLEHLQTGIIYSIPAVERAADEQAKAKGNGGGGNSGHA